MIVVVAMWPFQAVADEKPSSSQVEMMATPSKGGSGERAETPFLVNADVCPMPEDGIFDPNLSFAYESVVRRALLATLPGGAGDMLLNMVVQPSFASSFMVAVHEVEHKKGDRAWREYRLRLVRIRGDTWAEMMEEERQNPGSTVRAADAGPRPVDEWAVALGDRTVALLVEVWKGILDRTRYVREILQAPDGSSVGSVKLDGTRYHFWSDGKSAQTHSPDAGSLLDQFTRVGEELAQLAEAESPKRAAMESALQHSLKRLAGRIAKRKPCLRPWTASSTSKAQGGPVGR